MSEPPLCRIKMQRERVLIRKRAHTLIWGSFLLGYRLLCWLLPTFLLLQVSLAVFNFRFPGWRRSRITFRSLSQCVIVSFKDKWKGKKKEHTENTVLFCCQTCQSKTSLDTWHLQIETSFFKTLQSWRKVRQTKTNLITCLCVLVNLDKEVTPEPSAPSQTSTDRNMLRAFSDNHREFQQMLALSEACTKIWQYFLSSGKKTTNCFRLITEVPSLTLVFFMFINVMIPASVSTLCSSWRHEHNHVCSSAMLILQVLLFKVFSFSQLNINYKLAVKHLLKRSESELSLSVCCWADLCFGNAEKQLKVSEETNESFIFFHFFSKSTASTTCWPLCNGGKKAS